MLNNSNILLDVEDLWILQKYKWYIIKRKNNRFYVECSIGKKRILLHRFLLNINKTKIQIDHINGDGLDNRKSNLRICNNYQNSKNRKKSNKKTSSKYKGVSLKKSTGKWRCYIMLNYKEIHIGYFEKEIDAAKAYDEAAIKYFGEFARLNFPNEV